MPVRPKPVATSSQMSSTPARRQASPSCADVAGVGAQHARRPLHQRLDDDGGQFAGMRLDGGAGLVGPARVGVAGRAHDGEAQRIEDGAEHAAVAERERADGVAVVGVAQGQEGGAARLAPVDPVLEGDLEGLLHRHRAVGGEEEVGIVDRHHRGQRLGQLDHDGVAVAEHGGVGHLGRLLGQGRVELGHVVAEGVDPEGRDGIEVAVARRRRSARGPRPARSPGGRCRRRPPSG